MAAFCNQRGLRAWQFYEWKKRVRESEASRFVEVQVEVSAEPVRSVGRYLLPIGAGLRAAHSIDSIAEKRGITSPTKFLKRIAAMSMRVPLILSQVSSPLCFWRSVPPWCSEPSAWF